MALSRLAAAVCLLVAVGCGGSNEPSVAGTNSSPAQSGGKAGAGTATTPPASNAAGGSSASSNTGSSATAAAGGAAPASSSDAAGAKSSDSAAAASGMFSPLCSDVPATAAGAPSKGVACTASDAQVCYKTCGPQSVGFKSETCTNGAYVEQSGCSFPDGDYACYKIPTTVDASCPTEVPQATMPCEVAMCTPCNVGGNYLDSSGASKMGYCVCPMAGDSGSRKWSCASATAWPCPLGKGC
jgi:hypothetical protein